MYLKKDQLVYTVSVYNETAAGAIDFRVSGTFISQRDAIRAGNTEVEYYYQKGYKFSDNGWGDIKATKYVWQGYRAGGDFVMIIAQINPISE